MDPILNFAGEKVALGPLRKDLIATYARWVNDFEVTHTLAIGMKPLTLEAEEAWFQSQADAPTFTIYEKATLRPIGTTGLMNVDHQHRTAELGILIGEKDTWGRGYGTEATNLTLDYAFTGLGLHNVMLRVHASNARAIRAYERVGFKHVGRRRQAHRRGGGMEDVLYMDILAAEHESPVLGALVNASPS